MTERATFGGGCFWCIEAAFKHIKGVISVTSGYAGGTTENPTYKEVCNGATGHAEVIQVEFNPKDITFKELVNIFFHLHNPTELNRQGPDVGTQYRSIILFHDDGQKTAATEVKDEIEASGDFDDPIVTEIVSLNTFYPAEEYHQDYFEKNPNNAYCQININPKLAKLRKKYSNYTIEQ